MIEIKNLYAAYGRQDILKNLSLNIKKGEITAIVGKNGCGKTTLLKVMMHLLPSKEGEVLIDGKNVLCLPQKTLAKLCAYLPQTKSVPDMTVESMVLHGRFAHSGYPTRYTKSDRLEARRAMELMEISDLADTPIAELSGGTRQKAYIAMALCTGSPYILLDEPTSFLDISHQLKLCAILKSLACGEKGIVAVLHDIPLALSVADKVAVMKDGSILASGTPEEIVSGGYFEEAMGVEVFSLTHCGKTLYQCRLSDNNAQASCESQKEE